MDMLQQNDGPAEELDAVPVSSADERPAVADVAVIGAGPAGLIAGLYAARAGLDVAVFERLSPGGQLAQTELIENYPGFPQGAAGFDLAFSMKEQADRFGVRQIADEVTGVDLAVSPKRIDTAFLGSYFAKSVIVATGARPRKLGLPEEEALAGAGVSYCATCDGNFFRGKTVVVVGGGNTAVADAVYLSRICEKVYVVHRRDSLRATAVYHDKLMSLENVELVWNSVVDGLDSEASRLSGVRVRNLETGEQRCIACQGLFVAIGTQPNTEFLHGQLDLDGAGYIVAGESGATSAPGVFAAGDVRTKALRQVVTAVSDGAVTAEEAAQYLSI